MSYTDRNIPVIEQIKLPSGTNYFVADREIRDVVDQLSQIIAGGVSFVISWNGTTAPVVANIPLGVQVVYQDTTYTGTMPANNATAGAFYLVKTSTQAQGQDIYDEYVPVGPDGDKIWEKIGDTQVDISNMVTNVTLNKSESTVLTGLGTASTSQFVTSADLVSDTSGDIAYVEAPGTVSTSKLSASVTPNLSKGSAASSVTPTTTKLETTTITGINGSSNENVVKSRTQQTTADGTWTEVAPSVENVSTINNNLLANISVANGVLSIGAAVLDTQSTYSADEPSSVTIPTAASVATTVATGSTANNGAGADVVTNVSVGETIEVVTNIAPTVSLSTGSTGDVDIVTGMGEATVKYMSIDDHKDSAVTGYNSPTTATVLNNGTGLVVSRNSASNARIENSILVDTNSQMSGDNIDFGNSASVDENDHLVF